MHDFRPCTNGRARNLYKSFLGTASLVVLGSVVPAVAQPAIQTQVAQISEQTPEQVLVTGSLIHGTVAVGVPVTTLGASDFQQTGAITIADLLKDVPAIHVQPATNPEGGGGNEIRTDAVDIHNLNINQGVRTLMLIGGMRYSLQRQNATVYDPSIIPALALDRVDVLADGASATYGSDAIAGVVNVILRRGYNGAVTEGRVGWVAGSTMNSQVSQLFGHTWDSGDVTVTFEHWQTNGMLGKSRSFFTQDFTPWGLDNQNTIKSAIPGIVSTGAPNATVGTGCTNCWSVPRGQNGVGLTWATLLNNAGTGNEINSYAIADITNRQERNGAVATFDQRLLPGIELFADGFYSNRHVSLDSPATITPYNTLSLLTIAVPTINPFYPAGAPSGLRVSYNFADELLPLSTGHEIASRYSGGFNLTLPFGWTGRIFGAYNQELNQFDEQNSPNTNNVSAALGWTIAATPASGPIPGVASFTKPANVPYLNIFCDPVAFNCNSSATIGYINAYGETIAEYTVLQYGANFDGPLFPLPGGDVKAAVGGGYSKDNYFFETNRTRNSASATIVQIVPDNEGRQQWDAYAQLNVPLVGDNNAMPFVRKLELEGSFRFDRYSDFGTTTNPKLAADWEVVDGLLLRGSWGTSFRAPTLANISPVAARSISGVNLAGGATNNSQPACTTVGGAAPVGTAAALLNPACSAALNFPGGIAVQGGSGGLNGILHPANYALQPETGHNLTFGFDFSPKNYFDNLLNGFNINASWYKVRISNVISAQTLTGVGNALVNPSFQSSLLVKGQAGFDAALVALLASPQGPTVTAPASSILWILDSASQNFGSLDQQGVDFSVSYDVDTGEFGVWNAGITGDYKIHQILSIPGSIPVDNYDTNGQPLAFRLVTRSRLGWSMDGFSATLFNDFTSHVSSNNPLPPAAFLAKFPQYSNKLPTEFLWDLAVGYDTRDVPANPYLRNINLQIVVNNILDRAPPFAYNISSTSNGVVGYLPGLYSPYGRTISFTITKNW